MKYVPPYGVSDPNAPYVNGDPSIARQGSIPPAEAFEHPMREIENVIASNGIIPSSSDLDQLLEATRSQYANYCVDTGSINTLSVALNPPLAKYTVGLPLRVRVNQTNTSGASIDAGCGRVYIRRPDGSNVLPSDLPAGGIVDLVFDGTGFQMVNYLGGAAAGDIINNYNKIPYAVDTSPTANVIVAPFAPAITTLTAGDLLLVKVANTTTGPATLQVNAMAARPVKAMGTGDLLQNDITSGDIKLFYYDGTNFQITPNLLINANWTVQVPSQYPTVGAALSAIMRKRIHSSAIVTVQIAAGAVAPFSIYHPDADRLVIKGTMLAAAPTINDLQRTGATYAPIVADGWANLAVLKARYGTQITVAAGQTGIANVGPGNPTIADILIMGPFSMAANPSNAGNSWWDLSSAVWTEPNRTITCTNIAAWGMGWACFEGRGKLFAHNCITIASINGMSSRFAGGFIQANNCILNSNAYTGVNADSQSTWQGTGCYVLSNGTAGIQPLNLGYCEAYSCNITANGFWDVQSGYLSLSSLIGCAYITATPPMNGGIAGFGGVNQAG